MQEELKDPLIMHNYGSRGVANILSGLILRPSLKKGFLLLFFLFFLLLMIFSVAIFYLLFKGVGIWGLNTPVMWGFAITNFVWWIGIGHAGTFISAILLLLHQEWRTSVNRFAESMTLFALACAALMPLLHLGRPWFFYWLLPYPDTMGLWPQFRSPLVWDVFAVTTYLTVSLVFWYIGLIPDLATMRDEADKLWQKKIYGVLALGWRGCARHWQRYQTAYLLLAGLSTPLVISVHSVVSLDFSVSIVPGWHSTIFPPYFVAGAIFSGFAMVLTLAIPLRKFYKLEDFITLRHLDNCAKLMLLTGLIVGYSYVIEKFLAWYNQNEFETYMVMDRALGHYSIFFWIMIFCNVVIVQLLWWKSVRRNVFALFIISLFVNLGMWCERYVIVVQSLARDFMPSSWHIFTPTIWDYATFLGSMGLFFILFLIFIRTLPTIAISELSELNHKTFREQKAHDKA